MVRIYAMAAVVAVVGGVGGMFLYQQWVRSGDTYAQCRDGVAGGDIGGPFTLLDQTGKTVTEAEVFTKPSLVYFGYTFCPDICPFDNARNAEAVDVLEEMGQEVTPVFITVDPKRDTPEVMASYAENLHPRMVGLTGTPEQVKAAADAYRVYFNVPETDEEFYLVDHTTFTYLVMPQTGFVDFFRRETSPQEMAERVSCYLAS